MRKGIFPIKDVAEKRGLLLAGLKRSLDAEAFLRDIIGAERVSRNGDEVMMSCPLPFGLHPYGDRNPSFRFNTEKLVGICYGGCGGGDIFWLTENVMGVNRKEATRLLREQVTLDAVPSTALLEELDKLWDTQDEVVFTLPQYSRLILTPWKRYVKYWEDRGITKAVQREMETGIDLKHRDKYKGQWVEQPRVVVPHFFGGKLRGWTKRKVSDVQVGPKWHHSASFPKTQTLYAWDRIDRERPVVVVESPASVLRMRAQGFDNVVATFGKSVPDDQVALLRECEQVWVFFDGEYQAQEKAASVAHRLEKHTNTWVVPCPDEKDPGDLTVEQIRECYENREPSMVVV